MNCNRSYNGNRSYILNQMERQLEQSIRSVQLPRCGPWLRVGLSYVRGDDWMTRASLGFAIFSLEWQHRLAVWEPRNALMFQLRLPIGIYCFLSRKLESHNKTAAEVGAGKLELP